MITPDRIEQKDQIRVIGLNRSYNRETRGGIPQQWAEWDYTAVKPADPIRVFGVSHGFDGIETFDYICAMQVTEDTAVPDGQSDIIIPDGSYAIFVHDGHVSGIASVFDAVCKGVELGKDWQMGAGPQIEFYTEEFDPGTATGKVELWFPVSKA